MTANLTTTANLLKYVYKAPFKEQVYKKTLFLADIQKDSEPLIGADGKYILGQQGEYNQSFGSRSETGILPTAGYNQYAQASVSNTYSYSNLYVTDVLMEATKGNEAAYAKALEKEMAALAITQKCQLNRIFLGAGTGVIGMVGAATTSTYVVSIAASPTVYATNAHNIMHQFRVGMLLDIITVSTGASVATSLTVSSVDVDNRTVTLDTLVGPATTDGFVMHSSYSTTTCYEPTSIFKIIGTATFQGLDPATYTYWKSKITTCAGSTLTELKMMKVVDDISIYGNGNDCDRIWTSHVQLRKYGNILRTDRRFMNPTQYKGGWKAATFLGSGGEIPMVADRDLREDAMLFLCTKDLALFEQVGFKWMEEDGNMLVRVANYAAYEATMRWYGNIGCYARNTQGALINLDVA